ncbi:MAG: PAS domain S-box protein [Oscillochloris sp.]|nr:PAS domain S-box protein [Oscillochloris sp.]
MSLKLTLLVLMSGLGFALLVGNIFAYLGLGDALSVRLLGAILVALCNMAVVVVLLRTVFIPPIRIALTALRQIEAGEYRVYPVAQLPQDEQGELLHRINVLAAQLEQRQIRCERQQAELALAESRARAGELRYRLLFEKAPMAIWEFERNECLAALAAIAAEHDGDVRPLLRTRHDLVAVLLDMLRLTAANPAMLELFYAKSPEEIAHRPIHTTIAPESFDVMIDIFAEALAGASISNKELTILLPGGERRIGNVAVRRMEDADSLSSRVIVSLIDITASRHAEYALRESEERMRTLVVNITVGVMLHGCRGEFLLCNPAATKALGVCEADLLGKTTFEMSWSVIDEEGHEIPPSQRPVERVLRTGKPVCDMVCGLLIEHRLERVWLIVHATPQYSVDGSLRYVLCSFNDITERRRIEAQMRQAQKMEAVGRLAGGIAHDFNNILTVIIGTSDIILATKPADPDLRQDIEQIRSSSLRAAELTRQLLTFSRRQVIKPQLIDLGFVLNGIEALLRRLIGEHIEFAIMIDPNIAPMYADPSQIEQVIMNLSINSRDAMPHGGRLLIEIFNMTVADAMPGEGDDLVAGDYVLLAVSDSGLGIAEEHRAHIFEPFFTTKPVGQGTGLGLSTVHGIVRQSGGAMRFISQVGEGTRFEIYFPQAAGDVLPPADVHGVQGTYVGCEVVLLVEDEPSLRDLAQRVLVQHGYHVFASTSGNEARQLLAAYDQPVDLLITDLVIPGPLSGVQLAAEVQLLSPRTRVIYMSGYTDMLAISQHADIPERPFLQKPFTPEALMRLVRLVLDDQPSQMYHIQSEIVSQM